MGNTKSSQLKLGVVLSYVQMILSNAISIIYTPIMLRILGQSEYGLLSLSSSIINYLGLLQFGLSSSYTYFYYKKRKDNDKEIARLNGTYMTIFLIIACVAFLCGMVLVANTKIIFGSGLTDEELQKSQILMFIMVFSISITFPLSVFVSYANANEKFIFVRTLNILGTILGPMINLPLLLLGYGSVAITCTSLVLTIIRTIVNIFYCKVKLKMKFSFSKLQFSLLKSMFSFSFFIFLNQIVDQINWSIDRYIIARFYGTASVAVYSVGASFNHYYITFSSSISSVFSPRINKIVSNKSDDKELVKLMTRVGRIQFMILSLILTGFIFFGYYFIVGYYAGSGYEQSYIIALILLIPITIPLIQNTGIEIQRAKNKHHFRSIVYAGIAVANLCISIPLCKYFGIIGSAVGTSIGITLGNIIIMNWFYHKKLGLDMRYFWKNIAKVIPSMILPICIGVIFWKVIGITSLVRFLVLAIIYVVVFFVSLWLWGMNEEEKNLIRGPLNKVLSKFKK